PSESSDTALAWVPPAFPAVLRHLESLRRAPAAAEEARSA
ncbi:flavoprotein, partial [Rathayibacter sp. AY2B7]